MQVRRHYQLIRIHQLPEKATLRNDDRHETSRNPEILNFQTQIQKHKLRV